MGAPISPEPNPVNEGVSIINVHVPEQPSVGVTEIGITSETTIVELLHLFSQKHRLQLYTDSYIFYLNEEDQKRLFWMSPVVDKDINILELEIKDINFGLEK